MVKRDRFFKEIFWAFSDAKGSKGTEFPRTMGPILFIALKQMVPLMPKGAGENKITMVWPFICK